VLLTLPVRTVAVATPRARIVQLDLSGHAFEYLAGQAVIVTDMDGERRAYSIASAPEDVEQTGRLQLLVGVSADSTRRFAFEPGANVTVEGPMGAFTFPSEPAERHFLFVAGGTGIAPLRAMIRHAVADGAPPRTIGLLYSARTPEEFAFESEFQTLANQGAIELRQRVTRASEAEWPGDRGRIDRVGLSALVHDERTLCFVCGPAAMVDDIPPMLGEIGIARDRIRIEEW
jgi:ferredoxin-NADP reductase